MFFCPNCDTVFDITKVTNQNGGNLKNVLLNDSTTESLSELTSESLSENLFSDDSFDKNPQYGKGNNIDDYETIIKKIINNELLSKDMIINISLDELSKSPSFKKLKIKQKEYVYNKIQDLLPVDKKKILSDDNVYQPKDSAYFICNNCGIMKKINEGTLIFSRVSSNIAQSYSTSDYNSMVYSDILPRTRKYICPNDTCDSHTDPIKREAVFFRMNNTFKIKYICTACHTSF